MNIQEELNRISSLEAEIKEIREKLENAPEQRTPGQGDVYFRNGDTCLIDQFLGSTILKSGDFDSGDHQESFAHFDTATFRGKFDEVFVEISDVREALNVTTAAQAAEALRKLNIIK